MRTDRTSGREDSSTAGGVVRGTHARRDEQQSMGTTGFFGFVIDGTEKIGYSWSDSHPEGLGILALQWLIDHQVSLASAGRPGATNELIEQIRAIRVVDREAEPSAE